LEKTTIQLAAATILGGVASSKRTYGDACGIARALDVVGERWSLLVVRELLLGPKRFTDLRTGLAGIAPDVLSQRLRDLEAAGILGRRTLPPPSSARVYELTAEGRELEPVLQSLGRWGSRRPLGDAPPPLGPDAFVVALQTMYRADGEGETVELWLDERPYALRERTGVLAARQGVADEPAATIASDAGTLAEVLWHGGSLDAARAEDRVRIAGDATAAERLLSCCEIPVAVP
jgi:DNA-binding HxlR family transcriptional regulator